METAQMLLQNLFICAIKTLQAFRQFCGKQLAKLAVIDKSDASELKVFN
ncbi:MAG: hypothetical protein M3384_11735 [Acidobacteriota bacterium]|nr:hypothetical protein [Acidobacteriota bacterium]